MKTLIISCLILLSSSIFMNAQTIQEISLNSKELQHHIFDRPKTYSIGVYLPPSYNKSNEIFSVLYFLPGYGCGYFNKNKLIQDYQLAIESGSFRGMIVVFIDACTSSSNGSFYLDSEATGNWESFIVNKVVTYIDDNYRTLQTPESRAIAGHSMGGYGAINLGMLHSDVFGTVYSHSPGLFSETGLADCQMFKKETVIDAYITLEKELAAMSKEAAHTEYLKRLSSLNRDVRFAIEYGMAVAPNVNKNAPYTNYPYSKVGSKYVKDQTLWEQWESGFGGIADEVFEYKDEFLALDTLVIDYGSSDSYSWIPQGCIYMSTVLNNNNIAHGLEVYSGGHSNQSRYVDIMFPLLMNTLHFDENFVSSLNSAADRSQVYFYPNPAKDRVYVELSGMEENDFFYQISDMKGNILQKGMLKSDGIDIHSLPSACYILSISNGARFYSPKLLLK